MHEQEIGRIGLLSHDMHFPCRTGNSGDPGRSEERIDLLLEKQVVDPVKWLRAQGECLADWNIRLESIFFCGK